MDHQIARMRLPRLHRALTAALAALGLAATLSLYAGEAGAQQKKPAQQTQQPAQPQQPPAQQQPAQAPQDQQSGPSAQNAPQLIYSSWTKACQKGPETNNKQICIIHNDGRDETGIPLIVAEIFEPEGGDKTFRIMVPFPVLVQHGTRIFIDQQELARPPFFICGAQSGCLVLLKADDATISKLKKGKLLVVQAILPNSAIQPVTVPLGDFAKAFDGPPIDPKAFEAQQQKLQSELQKKAEEARKKLEQQPPATPPKQ